MGWKDLGPRALVAVCASMLIPLPVHAGESVDIPLAQQTASPGGGTPEDDPKATADDESKTEDAKDDEEDSGPTVLLRSESTDGEVSQTLALLTPEIEIWDYYAGTEFEDIEVGRLLRERDFGRLHAELYGYVAWFRQQQDWYLEPSISLSGSHKKDSYTVVLSPYIPLNNGPAIFYSDGTSFYHQATESLAVGLDSYVLAQEGEAPVLQWGPAVQLTGTGRATLLLRALVFGNSDSTYRIELDIH